MSEETAPERIAVVWAPEARADLRAIDRQTALAILHCLDRYLAEYVYRFNRRRRDPNTFGFLVRRLVTRPWTSEKRLKPAEASA